MERAMKRDNIQTNDRQLGCARISSNERQDYLKACRCQFCLGLASFMTSFCRQVFYVKINVIIMFSEVVSVLGYINIFFVIKLIIF